MATNIGVVLTDADRKIKWVNHDFEVMTGYSLLELIGKKPSLLQGKESDQSVIQNLKQSLDKKISIKDEITNYRKDGTSYKCRFVIHPIFDDKGIHTNYIAFEVDSSTTDDTNLPLLQLREKYSTSSLKDVDQTNLYARLTALMQQEQLYMNPDLALKDLANRLHTNTRYLSQVINTLTDFNLQHFINMFRIEEAKRKFRSQEYSNYTLFGIGQKCGFKNKSTFYKVFKDITGLTPKDYIKRLNN
jgi:PAS domain S-box-containing protein